ncbi:hypothetical protein BOX15_Mlig030605g1 [Macrostomum lignano]|uniref:Prominin n=1 Tax=Macrostomum lignano TaxID=282301 RepID=A0A267GDB3_9PLAT|nr:hypothetical protein BOX15_Mlig030605g1 [Macrostomum lignano]
MAPSSVTLALAAAVCIAAWTGTASADSLSDSVQPFYEVTEKFLDFIQPFEESALVTDIFTALFNDTVKSSNSSSSPPSYNWQKIISRYWESMKGYFILVCIGLFLIIFVPLAGLITCCCRCCCKSCGGKGSQMEKRGSDWRRVLYGVLLIVLTTAMVLGVVLAFISNELVREQMDPSRGKPTMLANFSLHMAGVAGMLSEVPRRARNNSFSAVNALIADIYPAVGISMVSLRDTLGSSSKADAVLADALRAMQLLGDAHRHSESYVRHHSNYSGNLNNLNLMLGELRSNLSGIELDCPFNAIQADCNLIGSRLPTLRVTQNDSQTGLLNVTQLNGLMREVNNTELTLQLLSAREALNNVSKVGTEIVTDYANAVVKSINSSAELQVIWGTVEHLFSSLNSFILNNSYKVNSTVVNPVTQRASSLDETAAHLDLIRYGSFIAIASLASVVIVLWYFGVMYGLCGEPPYEDARCCNKGVGADCLTVGLVIGFISYALLFIVTLALFLSGGLSDTEVCRYLTGRAGASGYKELDSDLNQFMRFSSPRLSVYSLNLVSGLLEGCSKGNESITAALNIQNLVQGRHISQRVYGFVNESNDLLMKRRSDLVAKVALDLNFTHAESVSAAAAAQPLIPFLNELHKPLIEGSESVFAAIQNISITASKATDKARFVALFNYLNLNMRQAEMLQQSQFMSLDGLRTSLRQLNATVSEITNRLRDAHNSVHTLYNIEIAIKVAMANLTAQLGFKVQDTIELVVGAAANCAELHQKLKSLIDGPCVKLLRPLNGFWAGMGLCLICMLPCLVLAFKLANLFRKTHKNQADYSDNDYSNATYREFYRISTISQLLKPPLQGVK